MIIDQAIGKTGLRLESDPMRMRRSHQITSGMSLLLGYDTGTTLYPCPPLTRPVFRARLTYVSQRHLRLGLFTTYVVRSPVVF